MTNAKSYEEITSKLITPIVEQFGCTLVDVEYARENSGNYLRVYIEKDGGVSIDDCVDVSRAFNPILDEKDFIEEAYTFEVSSPGADRVLKKDTDLKLALGRSISIKTYQKINGKKEFVGILKEWDDSSVTITDEDGDNIDFNRSDVSIMRLLFDMHQDLEEDKKRSGGKQ